MAGGGDRKGGNTVRAAWKKLRRRGGETLTETLCAVLIVALSSTILATMLAAASRMNASAIDQDRTYYSELNDAETRAAGVDGTVMVTGDADGRAFSVPYAVKVHGSGDTLTTYSIKGGP